jgi:hypothetical protein
MTVIREPEKEEEEEKLSKCHSGHHKSHMDHKYVTNACAIKSHISYKPQSPITESDFFL